MQLTNYIIDRITPTGNPVYKPESEAIGDHALDAMMLSIIAFILEKTPLGKPRYTNSIAFSGRLGERTEPEAGNGDIVIQGNRRENPRDRTKPTSRTETGNSLLFKPRLPGFNMRDSGSKAVDPDEFATDIKKPRQNPKNGVRYGLAPRVSNRPSRKNI